LESYCTLWRQAPQLLVWRCLFVLPFWLDTVWRHLGGPGQVHIVRVEQGERSIGIAPLALDGDTARFMGSHEVCDYQDLVTEPGKETVVMSAIIAHLQAQGITRLDLRTLRPDALALNALKQLAPQQIEAALIPDDVTYEMELPDTWDGYLMHLNGKQRHEVRRKLRRLEYHGAFSYCAVTRGDGLDQAVQTFLDLFQRNRQDKAQFMNDDMAVYFQDLMLALSQEQMLRICTLNVENQPAAAVLCFDYEGTRYLYNSGYDANFDELSVGVLSKVLSIEHAIGAGCRRYDFLKGAEVYKKRIGGSQVPLYRCKMDI